MIVLLLFCLLLLLLLFLLVKFCDNVSSLFGSVNASCFQVTIIIGLLQLPGALLHSYMDELVDNCTMRPCATDFSIAAIMSRHGRARAARCRDHHQGSAGSTIEPLGMYYNIICWRACQINLLAVSNAKKTVQIIMLILSKSINTISLLFDSMLLSNT